MAHNANVEMQGKCRRLFYAKIDGPPAVDVDVDGNLTDQPGTFQYRAGDVVNVASGGGAIEGLTGNDLIIATYNDITAPDRIGCIEMFYNPIPATKPKTINLGKVQGCWDAVDSYRTAKQAEDDFVFEKAITLLGSELSTTEVFRHSLKVEELHTRDNSARTSNHDGIVQAQSDLEALSKDCEDCCEQLLVTRDDALTFAEPIS